MKNNNPFEKFFITFANETFTLLKLNLIYVLFLVPIITSGPATIALSKISCKLLNGDDCEIFKLFLKEFKDNFKNGIKFFCFQLITLGITLTGIILYSVNNSNNNLLYYLFTFIGIFIIIFIIMMSFYFYPMAGFIDLPFKTLFSNSWRLAIGFKGTSFLSIIICSITILLNFIYFEYTLPLIAIITFSFTSILVNAFIYPKLKQTVFPQKNEIE